MADDNNRDVECYITWHASRIHISFGSVALWKAIKLIQQLHVPEMETRWTLFNELLANYKLKYEVKREDEQEARLALLKGEDWFQVTSKQFPNIPSALMNKNPLERFHTLKKITTYAVREM